MSSKPIGIFDSGIGGLTVCRAIHDMMPKEDIIYFGDTARFPYGTRSQETIIKYSREIVNYLISKDVKMIVIACNTASAAALDTLRAENNIDIVGVIEAGAKAACSKYKENSIGVIATRATVNSNSYKKAIANINPNINVVQQQATLFVSLAEEGMTETEIAKLTAKEYLEEMYSNGVRTLILGCTHFPLLKKSISAVYPDMNLIDTGIEIAHEVKSILTQKNQLQNSANKVIGSFELYASDITDSMQSLKDIFFGANSAKLSKLVI